jgi:hypothetical protein
VVADLVRIHYVTARDGRVETVGGVSPDGAHWLLDHDEAVAGVEHGRWEFYVRRASGHAVRVVVACSGDRPYLKTEADGETPHTLLALPECP